MKEKIKKIMYFTLMILGITLIIIQFYNEKRLRDNTKLVTIDQVTPEQIQENTKEILPQEDYDYSQIEEITPTNTYIKPEDIDNNLLIGQIVIPSIKLNLSIFKVLNSETLLAGTAIMKNDDKFGQGNLTIAGHYNKKKNILFGGLMDVKIGDIVKVTDKTTIYEYKVYETKVVPDTAMYMIDNNQAVKRGNNIISLMTCYYSSKTGKRYFVLGDLVKSYPYTKEDMEYDK